MLEVWMEMIYVQADVIRDLAGNDARSYGKDSEKS